MKVVKFVQYFGPEQITVHLNIPKDFNIPKYERQWNAGYDEIIFAYYLKRRFGFTEATFETYEVE